MSKVSSPVMSIIVLNYNGKGFLEDCLSSIFKSNYSNFEVILVDNSSTDDSLVSAEAKFAGDLRLKIIKNSKNLLFTGGNNRGINEAKGEYVIVLNNDTTVHPDWLNRIASVMQDETIGAAQPKILLFDEPSRIDYMGGALDRYGYAEGIGRGQIDNGQFDNMSQELFYAGGTCMILRKKYLDEVGLFDGKFGAHWEDTDLSWRLRLRGYRIVAIPKAIVYHRGSKTMKKFARREDVSWHIRKNRISGLIKNYCVLNLIKTLPILVMIYLLIFIKEIVIDRNIKIALSSIFAIGWNIKELPYILRQRKIVQNKIRRLSDKEITKSMRKGFIAFNFLKEEFFVSGKRSSALPAGRQENYSLGAFVYGSHNQIIELVGRNKKVIDVGCNKGYLSSKFKENGCYVVGIEADLESANIAKKICDEIVIGDIEQMEKLQYPDNYFDCMVLADVLEHLKNPEKALLVLKRYLNTKGFIVASLPNIARIDIRLNLLFGKFDYTETGILDRTHLRFFTLTNAKKLFTDCGYKILQVNFTGRFKKFKLFSKLMSFQFIISAKKA